MIFALSLFNNYLATSAKRLGDSIINVHRNYDDFCIGSALSRSFAFLSRSLSLSKTKEGDSTAAPCRRDFTARKAPPPDSS
jgi:hypothetical protein